MIGVVVVSSTWYCGMHPGTAAGRSVFRDKRRLETNNRCGDIARLVSRWSLVIGHWSFIIRHWSLVVGPWLLVTELVGSPRTKHRPIVYALFVCAGVCTAADTGVVQQHLGHLVFFALRPPTPSSPPAHLSAFRRDPSTSSLRYIAILAKYPRRSSQQTQRNLETAV